MDQSPTPGPARAGAPGASVEGTAAAAQPARGDSGDEPGAGATALDRTLALVPRVLSSHAHIIFLFALGVYLIVLPIVGVHVSARIELIGGNYTNVTSDIAASIAAGLTVKIHRDRRADRKRIEQLHASLDRLHERLGPLRGEAVAPPNPPS